MMFRGRFNKAMFDRLKQSRTLCKDIDRQTWGLSSLENTKIKVEFLHLKTSLKGWGLKSKAAFLCHRLPPGSAKYQWDISFLPI